MLPDYRRRVQGRVALATAASLPLSPDLEVGAIVDGALATRMTPQVTRDLWTAVVDQYRVVFEEDYVPAAASYGETVEGARSQADRAWRRYESRVSGQFGLVDPEHYRSGVNEELRDRFGEDAILVRRGWVPSDRAAFSAIVTAKVRRSARRTWDAGSRGLLDQRIDPSYWTFERFFGSRPVQQRL